MRNSTASLKLKTLLRKVGLKATPSRIRVFELLQASKDPLSAQHVIDSTKDNIDQATVYRILKSFKEKGVVQQIDLRHNHAHYELFKNNEHHHLICMHCGRIEDVDNCGVEETHANVLKHAKYFSEIKEHALEFYGVCKSCAKKQDT